MFPRFLVALSVIAVLASCGDDTETVVVPSDTMGTAPKLKAKDANLEDWMNYYRENGVTFGASQFELIDTSTAVEQLPGNIRGSFDPEFDSVYYNFIVYSPDRTRYIDLDSYQWSIIDNEPAFDVDQEIDLVDLKTKTVRRMAFRGPSQRVENASWKNNSVVYLLEVSDERELFVNEMDLETGKTRTYRYKGKLPFRSDYAKKRMERRLQLPVSGQPAGAIR